MTATTTAVQDPPARGFTRRRVIVVVLLLAGVAAVWWMTHPRVFLGVGNQTTGTVPVGTYAYVGMQVIPQDGMDLHGATPRVVFNSGDVEASVAVCPLAGRDGVGFVYEEDIESLCESLRAPVGPVQRGDFLVLEVVGSYSGLIAVDGIDLTYSTGIQRGTQAIGMETAVIVEDR